MRLGTAVDPLLADARVLLSYAAVATPEYRTAEAAGKLAEDPRVILTTSDEFAVALSAWNIETWLLKKFTVCRTVNVFPAVSVTDTEIPFPADLKHPTISLPDGTLSAGKEYIVYPVPEKSLLDTLAPRV